MIVMVFEYELAEDAALVAAYNSMSEELRSRLSAVPGGVEIERFESCTTPGRYLAVGSFTDENSVGEWRGDSLHREAQRRGRHEWFTNYRLRMAEVIRDYGPDQRHDAPDDAKVHDRHRPSADPQEV